MRILIHAIHYPICSARYAVDAFSRLGHDVKHVGHETGNEVWGLWLEKRHAWAQDTPSNDWTPDLCILMDTAYQWCHPVIPTVVWTVDNHARVVRQPGIKHYFLAHSEGASQPVTQEDETWVPCGYAPDIHYVTTPWEQRPYHCCMVGVMYEERAQIVNKMAEAGLRVLAGTGAILDAYRANYNQALISVCRSIKGDLAQRVFETAAMGCLILSDRVPDMDKIGMVEGVHYVGYETADEATAKALEIVNDWEPERVKAMIGASLEWVKPHTWDARCQTILEVMGL